MKIQLQAFACHDTDANTTNVRTQVLVFASFIGDGSEVLIHQKTTEVLWDDTHEIAVRCQLQKATQKWAEQMWGSLEPF